MSKRLSVKTKKAVFSLFFAFLVALVVLLLPTFGGFTAKKLVVATVSEESRGVSEASGGSEVAYVTSAAANGFEIPARVGEHQVVTHPGYTLSYNEEYEQADWVAYTLDTYELNTKVTGRTENFREDPDIATQSAHLSDYKGSGYTRGHLLSSANRTSSVELNEATFLLSNISPMKSRYNSGLFLSAENAERDVARQYGKAYIVTGPVFSDDMQRIGECNVAVPNAFYKVFLVFDNEGVAYSIGMILPQQYEDGTLRKYLCSVNDVEKATGLDFFVLLPDDVEEKIENQKDIYKWPKSMR